MFKKIIIWGHPLHSHTHSYIHNGYYKAFLSLGYETYWLTSAPDNFNFENCLFFTEDQVQHNIPLVKSAKYILHHTKLDKYIDNNLSYINLANYLKWCDDGISAYFRDEPNPPTVEKLLDYCFWDDKWLVIAH